MSTKRKVNGTDKKKTGLKKIGKKVEKIGKKVEKTKIVKKVEKTKGTKRKRPSRKKPSDAYSRFKSFLILKDYSLRNIREFELSIACAQLQSQVMELNLKLEQQRTAQLVVID